MSHTVTKLINLIMSWHNKKEVKLGNIGERIVRELIEKYGYVHYGAFTNAPHLIDFFCLRDGKDLFCIEVKTKKRMAKMDYTGFNTRHFEEYKNLCDIHNVDLIIIFVDDFEECIYSAKLSEIREHGKEFAGVTVFPLSLMKFIRRLTKDELIELNESYTANYNYDNTERFFNDLFN